MDVLDVSRDKSLAVVVEVVLIVGGLDVLFDLVVHGSNPVPRVKRGGRCILTLERVRLPSQAYVVRRDSITSARQAGEDRRIEGDDIMGMRSDRRGHIADGNTDSAASRRGARHPGRPAASGDFRVTRDRGKSTDHARQQRGVASLNAQSGCLKVIDTARTVMPSVVHVTDQDANTRAEVSHHPTRPRERQMRRFTSAAQLQRFASVHGIVQPLFRVSRHLLRSAHHRLLRTRAFVEWNAVTCAC